MSPSHSDIASSTRLPRSAKKTDAYYTQDCHKVLKSLKKSKRRTPCRGNYVDVDDFQTEIGTALVDGTPMDDPQDEALWLKFQNLYDDHQTLLQTHSDLEALNDTKLHEFQSMISKKDYALKIATESQKRLEALLEQAESTAKTADCSMRDLEVELQDLQKAQKKRAQLVDYHIKHQAKLVEVIQQLTSMAVEQTSIQAELQKLRKAQEERSQLSEQHIKLQVRLNEAMQQIKSMTDERAESSLVETTANVVSAQEEPQRKSAEHLSTELELSELRFQVQMTYPDFEMGPPNVLQPQAATATHDLLTQMPVITGFVQHPMGDDVRDEVTDIAMFTWPDELNFSSQQMGSDDVYIDPMNYYEFAGEGLVAVDQVVC